MLKTKLVLLIAKTALSLQKNHINRIYTCQQLADKNKQPIKFLTSQGKHYYYIFSISNIDLKYEDDGKNWSISLI